MKNLIRIIITAFFISMIYSCFDPEPVTPKNDYTIKNVSSYNVKLKVFDAYFDYLYKDTTFLININEEIYYRYVNRSGAPFGGGEDSAYVIFDDIRQIIYRRYDGNPKNILDINSYYVVKNSDTWQEYEYFITDDDYDNAEEIK